MAQSTNITLNDFAVAGYRDSVESFRIWREYEPFFEGKGRSVFKRVRTVLKTNSNARDFSKSLAQVAAEIDPKYHEILVGKGISPRPRNLTIFSDLANKPKKEERFKDGNDLGRGYYAPARKALEDGVNPVYGDASFFDAK